MTDDKTVEFSGKNYSQSSLSSLNDEELLSLRNLVADNLGVAKIKGFRDHDQAVEATWKALLKFADTPDDKLAAGDKPKKEKAKKEPKPPRDDLKYMISVTPKRPTKKMFAKIHWLRDHEGNADRAFARPGFPEEMRVIDAMLDPKLHYEKIYWWSRCEPPYLELIEPTEAEYETLLDKWYADNGIENPAAARKKKAEEREAEKAKRAEEKAAKDKEREAKKAEREAAKAKASEKADA